MGRRFSWTDRWLGALAVFAWAFPAGVRASTLGALKKFRWVNPLLDVHGAIKNPYQRVLENHADGGLFEAFRGHAEVVERSQQKVGSAVIAGTWLQTVKDGVGNIIFQSGETIESLPAALPTDFDQDLRNLQSREALVVASFYDQVPEYYKAARRFKPKLEIVSSQSGFETNWLADFIDETETRAFQIRSNADGKVIGVKEIGSGLSEGLGNVFPRGPVRSAVSEVPLEGLDGSGVLNSERVSVSSAAIGAAKSPQLDFRFPPADDRFDQVQVFFYAEQTLTWFRQNFDATPQSQLKIRVQVGNHSNTAFYLRDSIQLGSGDDQRYHGLARDPSIVMHEVGHAIVDRYAGLPSEGEGGSLNEAFADFFAASLLDNPAMGEASFVSGPFVRTLDNTATAPTDLSLGLYKASQVFSGTLWEIRKNIGNEKSELLAFRTLCRLGAGAKFADFAEALTIAATPLLDQGSLARVEDILKSRGLVRKSD